MARDPKKNLGRGLGALLGDMEEDRPVGGNPADRDESVADRSVAAGNRSLPIGRLQPGPFQPRRHFAEEDLEALAQSIREKGILQPILVRPVGSSYEIVAGERRWRAAQLASLHEVPVVIRELEDATALEIALVENVQRQDLTPVEEAVGYRRLMDEFGHTQEDLAKVIGKSRSHVANTLRLLALPPKVLDLLEDGKLSAGHARALLTSDDPEGLAEEVLRKALNVRQTEALARKAAGRDEARHKVDTMTGQRRAVGRAAHGFGSKDKDPDTLALEADIRRQLGLEVSIEVSGTGEQGVLAISYGSLDQLDDLIQRLTSGMAIPAAVAGMAAAGGSDLLDGFGDGPVRLEDDVDDPAPLPNLADDDDPLALGEDDVLDFEEEQPSNPTDDAAGEASADEASEDGLPLTAFSLDDEEETEEDDLGLDDSDGPGLPLGELKLDDAEEAGEGSPQPTFNPDGWDPDEVAADLDLDAVGSEAEMLEGEDDLDDVLSSLDDDDPLVPKG